MHMFASFTLLRFLAFVLEIVADHLPLELALFRGHWPPVCACVACYSNFETKVAKMVENILISFRVKRH